MSVRRFRIQYGKTGIRCLAGAGFAVCCHRPMRRTVRSIQMAVSPRVMRPAGAAVLSVPSSSPNALSEDSAGTDHVGIASASAKALTCRIAGVSDNVGEQNGGFRVGNVRVRVQVQPAVRQEYAQEYHADEHGGEQAFRRAVSRSGNPQADAAMSVSVANFPLQDA